ncbi:MAG: V-type ATP synthase subunit F [Clostridiales bacterium]|nr:V-type ATP synthase subunit F [Clostridiales bacterium]
MDSHKMGVVGEKDAVLAFRALGMEGVDVTTPAQVSMAVHQLVQSGIKVIFITEKAAKWSKETLNKYRNDPKVAIIPIPGTVGTDGFGLAQVKDNVEKAIGADILFQQNENPKEKEG